MRSLVARPIVLILALLAHSVFAQQSIAVRSNLLVGAFEKAKRADPLYRAAQAEFDSNIITSRVAGTAYYPQLKFGSQQLDSESGGQRYSLSVVQPVISADRYATLKEKEPRERLAHATLAVREMDLARRLFTSISDLLSARESLRENQARLAAQEQQVRGARRMLELGQGTITDVRDAEVKVLLARGEDLRLRGQQSAAEKLYGSIVGESPPVNLQIQRLTNGTAAGSPSLADKVEPRADWLEQNPDVIVAAQQRRLAELAATRSRTAWIPEVNVAYTMTTLNGQSNRFVGFSVSLPLQAGTVLNMGAADAIAVKAAEDARDKERQAQLEVDRLKTLVEFGATEVAMRRAAVEAAELSVIANERSFKGGVRTQTDVLASIEQVYTLRSEHLKAMLALSENLLNLRLQQGLAAADSLAEVQALLLE